MSKNTGNPSAYTGNPSGKTKNPSGYLGYPGADKNPKWLQDANRDTEERIGERQDRERKEREEKRRQQEKEAGASSGQKEGKKGS